MIKLIASDLDGTLLHNGAQELSSYTIDLIHRITEKGIHFVAASGRQYDNERRLFADIKDEISYIAENGSICIHQGKVISRGIIPDDLAYRIMHEIKKEPGYEIVASREDTCLIEDNDPAFVNHIVNVMHNTTEIVDDITKVEGPFLKLAIANMQSHDLGQIQGAKSRQDHLSGSFKNTKQQATQKHGVVQQNGYIPVFIHARLPLEVHLPNGTLYKHAHEECHAARKKKRTVPGPPHHNAG